MVSEAPSPVAGPLSPPGGRTGSPGDAAGSLDDHFRIHHQATAPATPRKMTTPRRTRNSFHERHAREGEQEDDQHEHDHRPGQHERSLPLRRRRGCGRRGGGPLGSGGGGRGNLVAIDHERPGAVTASPSEKMILGPVGAN